MVFISHTPWLKAAFSRCIRHRKEDEREKDYFCRQRQRHSLLVGLKRQPMF
jgi:hypothetical protein